MIPVTVNTVPSYPFPNWTMHMVAKHMLEIIETQLNVDKILETYDIYTDHLAMWIYRLRRA